MANQFIAVVSGRYGGYAWAKRADRDSALLAALKEYGCKMREYNYGFWIYEAEDPKAYVEPNGLGFSVKCAKGTYISEAEHCEYRKKAG